MPYCKPLPLSVTILWCMGLIVFQSCVPFSPSLIPADPQAQVYCSSPPVLVLYWHLSRVVLLPPHPSPHSHLTGTLTPSLPPTIHSHLPPGVVLWADQARRMVQGKRERRKRKLLVPSWPVDKTRNQSLLYHSVCLMRPAS